MVRKERFLKMGKDKKKNSRKNRKMYTVTQQVDGKRFIARSTKSEADAWLKLGEKRARWKENDGKDHTEYTLTEYYEKIWKPHREKDPDIRPSTVYKQDKQYNGKNSGLKGIPVDDKGTKLGTMKLSMLTEKHIQRVQWNLKTLAVTRKNGETVKKYKSSGVNDLMAFLKHILSDAYKADEYGMPKNPAANLKPLKVDGDIKITETKHRALSKDEMKAFLSTAKANRDWYYPLYLFMLHTGSRVGEAGALLRSDIKKDVISIQRTITKDELGSHVIGKTTKTSSGKRPIDYTDDIRHAVAMQEKQNSEWFPTKRTLNTPIFCSPNGKQLRSGSVDIKMESICKKAGIEPFTSHAFRDTFATWAIEDGMPIKVLQSILGHADFGTTMNTYVHTLPETRKVQMQALKFDVI